MNRITIIICVLLFGLPASALAQSETAGKIVPALSLLFNNEKFKAVITGLLNDTGIDWSGEDPAGNSATCTSMIPGPQDCDQGRDASHNNDGDGHAGFSFVKIDSNGVILNAGVPSWDCVGDKVTGLMWEAKTDDGGLHDKDDTFTWYNLDNATNGGDAGSNGAANNTCLGYNVADADSYCNTHNFIQRVNDAALCDYSNWRLPTSEELRSIADYSMSNPAIDSAYFPNTRGSSFWSAAPDAADSSNAWAISFLPTSDSRDARTSSYYVRLVRSE